MDAAHAIPFTVRQLHVPPTSVAGLSENFTYEALQSAVSSPFSLPLGVHNTNKVHFTCCVDLLQMMKYDETLMSELVL